MSTTKPTPAQQVALDNMAEIGTPATSQQIKVQMSTMRGLEKKGLARITGRHSTGRECEALLWESTNE